MKKQTIPVQRRGAKSLFNFGSVSYITIIKTKAKLKRPGTGKVPPELKDPKFVDENNSTTEFIKEIKLIASSRESRTLIEQSLEEPLKQIFVIMKFGDDELNSAYEGVIKPLGKQKLNSGNI